MANQFSFVTEAVGFDAEFNRELALRKCVVDCPRLWDVWHEYAREFSDYEEWSPSEWADHIKDFIREKNIKITSENLFARIVDGRYTINISYVIEW